MPRNFWLEASVDGRQTRIETGPRAKDGGFSLRILMRDEGSILQALYVYGIAREDGSLVLAVTTTNDSRRRLKDGSACAVTLETIR